MILSTVSAPEAFAMIITGLLVMMAFTLYEIYLERKEDQE